MQLFEENIIKKVLWRRIYNKAVLKPTFNRKKHSGFTLKVGIQNNMFRLKMFRLR